LVWAREICGSEEQHVLREMGKTWDLLRIIKVTHTDVH
jgi:hypothetical protein